jgi:pSer/pThr/pTyr-binding forkhead associated (FHA) protein
MDYFAMAQTISRKEFVRSYEFPFLVGVNAVARPVWAQLPTERSPQDFSGALSTRPHDLIVAPTVLQVFAVKKQHATFESMITVGRSRNNDIPLEDKEVSKFHAFFMRNGDVLELHDGGSLNGTFIGDVRLEGTRGQPIHSGDHVRFGHIKLDFLDTGACYDWLREMRLAS